jgi:VIT family
MEVTAQKQTIVARQRFVTRYLDPASRLGEILFGLIMVLTITLAAGFAVTDDRAGVRELLLAAIGCNVAWGIIDAVMYLMNCVTVRSGKIRLVQAVQAATDTNAALELVQTQIEPELQELVEPDEARAFSESVLTHLKRARITKTLLTRDDLYGALACFWLVFLSCLPAAIPFFIFSRPHLALRVSNGLLIVLLFLVGRKWARHIGTNQLAAGSAMVVIGLTLVGIAVLLGG